MKKFGNFLSYIISVYIVILPILPSKFKYKNIPLNADVLLAVMMIIFMIAVIINKDIRKKFVYEIKRDFFINYNSLFMFLWIAMMFISISYAVDKNLALKESIRISTYLFLFFMIKYYIIDKKMINRIMYSSIASAMVISIIGIAQYCLGKGIKYYGGGEAVSRIVSTLENSNNLGAFFILFIFPFIILFIKEKQINKKIIFGFTTLIFLLNIILSFSRNAWLALIIGYIALIFIYNFRLIYGVIIAIPIGLMIPQISNRIRDIGNLSQNLSRLSLWEIALKMIKDNKILGVGNGNYRTLYEEYYKKVKKIGYYKAHENFHPHNAYLKAQCELGIVGSISLIGFLISSLIKNNRFSNNVDNNFYKHFYKGFTASIVAFMFMNFIDNFFSAPKVIAFFFIFLAISDSYSYNIQNKSL
ncbi:O-antigen ligase family protein [Clostridium sporogenes]|uniref:O-antigen ligase domain-containing protein n=1 Tax=Clostridium botulinum TaxID=1491 RepID=A0A6M0T434_CLOBO|nr:O-antigen ligase family protein [Clostridium sporogenes]NFA60911.1 O-antigen ligase domain-containing protein [Clostridium botulinum]NFI75389.1 O-antigen ligase family protein [Clostridium sporogenes]NFL73266.1 O-antigen ligase family protein [Clostridium sporogenes]NFM25679.1 O-antigen ligase family protein [Clostridium sporogenes]NFP63325.1 O-antigen ligase family protein [Clostridium sporogenes]